MSAPPRGPELAEVMLALLSNDDAQVIVEERAHIDQRWARNSGTTNGSSTSTQVTVIVTKARDSGIVSASCSSSVRATEDLASLASRAREALVEARNDEHAPDPVPVIVDADFSASADALLPEHVEHSLRGLGSLNDRLAKDGIECFGYLEREQVTRWLATSSGARRRNTEIQDRLEMTSKADDRRTSTWHGQATLDLADEDAMVERIRRELDWQRRIVEIEPGRHTVVLAPSAVADLCVEVLWSSGARDAADGRTAFHDSLAASGTRLGQLIADERVNLSSDAQWAVDTQMRTVPFALTESSGRYASVLDNGLDLGPQSWIRDGRLFGLHGPTSDGLSIGVPVSPVPGNLIVEISGGAGGIEDLVASVEDGLVVTCLWYIRMVDPQTMTLTGLTRDGVYRVRDGAVIGAAGNFRFNDSPLGMLNRIERAGSAVRTLPREMADYANRTVAPPVVVRDLNLTSRSDAV